MKIPPFENKINRNDIGNTVIRAMNYIFIQFILIQRLLRGMDGGSDGAGLRDLQGVRHTSLNHSLPGPQFVSNQLDNKSILK
jgi:hypothetical protein